MDSKNIDFLIEKNNFYNDFEVLEKLYEEQQRKVNDLIKQIEKIKKDIPNQSEKYIRNPNGSYRINK
jgi:hypothetical protein